MSLTTGSVLGDQPVDRLDRPRHHQPFAGVRARLGHLILPYELALLKRHAFGKRSEQLNVLQISLLDEVVDAEIAAIETELEALAKPDTPPATKMRIPVTFAGIRTI